MATKLTDLTLRGFLDALRRREVTAREMMRACLERIREVDGSVRSFLRVDEEDALRQADEADLALRNGGEEVWSHKPLLGVPIALKDVIAVRGQPLGCGSRILEGYLSPYDATVTRKLKEAGAIVFGRLNMDEFAMGSSTENSAYGATRNPWDLTRTPGGSSGGAAAAVVARECLASLGSDTGGSVRQPASFCGCVGLKPTYGRVSRYGLVAYASSLDQIGPLGRTVEDVALVLGVIGGHDPKDSTSLPRDVPDYSAGLGRDLRGVRLGVAREYMVGGLDPEVKSAVDGAVGTLQELGAEVREVSLPHADFAVAAYYIVATAEASSNLARFDGIRYGLRREGSDPLELYRRTRGAGFGTEVKRRIILGTYVLSSGYYDAFYLRAQKVRTLIRRDFLEAFEEVDAIVTPTAPTAAFRLGEKCEDPLQMYLSDIYTLSCNLAGLCGLSLPCGFTREPRLPIGLQLLGRPLGEAALLRIAHAYERATSWHQARPTLGVER